MRIAIVEDDKKEMKIIVEFLTACLNKMGMRDRFELLTFYSGEDFVEHYAPGLFSFILLDIVMGDVSGIDVARHIRDNYDHVAIAFITTSNDYASQSYEVKAHHYLQKPVSEASIIKMMSNVDFMHMKKTRFIELPDKTRLFISDILYTNRLKHNVTFYLLDGTSKTVRLTQKEVESLLIPNPEFIIVGQGAVVNLCYVQGVSKKNLIISNGDVLPIPKRKYTEIKDVYTNYCFEMAIREAGM